MLRVDKNRIQSDRAAFLAKQTYVDLTVFREIFFAIFLMDGN